MMWPTAGPLFRIVSVCYFCPSAASVFYRLCRRNKGGQTKGRRLLGVKEGGGKREEAQSRLSCWRRLSEKGEETEKPKRERETSVLTE